MKSAELACVFIKKYKCWRNACVSLHPNVECRLIDINAKIEPIATVEINLNNNFDLYQKEGLNIKVLIGKNGCGKTKLLDALRNNFSGIIYILKDYHGHFAANKKIKIKNGDSFFLLDSFDSTGFKNISAGGLLQTFANGDSSNSIKEELFAFRYNFLSLYQKNPRLYNLEKNNPLFSHFSIKPKQSFSYIIQMYWNEKAELTDYDFEDCLKENPFLMILLYQINSKHFIWNGFRLQKDTISFNDLISFLGKNLSKDLKLLQKKYSPILKRFLFQRKDYKKYKLEQFLIIKEKWEMFEGILGKLHKDLDDCLSSSAPPNEAITINLDLFYYDGERIIESETITYDDFSDGEKQSLKIRYLMFPGLTQVKEGCGLWMVYDEPLAHLHPEWARQFMSTFIENFKYVKKCAIETLDNLKKIDEAKEQQIDETIRVLSNRKFSVIIATHSPFLLSDLFEHNIIYLKKENNHTAIYPFNKRNFAANIGEMFYDSFFMQNTIGSFAESKLKELIRKKQGKKTLMSDKEAEAILQSIGDPVIRSLIDEIEANDE